MKKILMTLTLAIAATIAIPSVANAQDAKPEQKKECCTKTDCKKSDCTKENCEKSDCKNCKKECTKPCMKNGKGKKAMGPRHGKNMRADGRKMNGHKNAKMRRGIGENPMFKGITLSDEQQQKIKALREKNMTEEKKAKAEMKVKSREEMQKIRADFDKEVEKILDKDQLKQYQANKAEMDAKRVARAKKSDK